MIYHLYKTFNAYINKFYLTKQLLLHLYFVITNLSLYMLKNIKIHQL